MGMKKGEEEVLAISFKSWHAPAELDILDSYDAGMSKIIIGVEKGQSSPRYYVSDPSIFQQELVSFQKAAGELIYTLTAKDELSKEKMIEILKKKKIYSPTLWYYVERELWGYGPLEPVMKDPRIENIECNGAYTPVTVTHTEFGRIESNMIFEAQELDNLVMKLAHMAGKSVSIFKPYLDNITIPGGHRFTCTYRTEISASSTFTIRKFPEKPWTIGKLLVNETISPEMAAWAWMMLETKQAMLVAGVMGSGKTSTINALTSFIPPNMRIGSAEDVPEFRLPHKYWVRYVIREPYTIEGLGAVTIFDLLKLLLRSNVDYILVNEIRGEDAKVWLQAISTGHGGITSIHAENPETVFVRLEQLGIPTTHLAALRGIMFIAFVVKDIGKGYFKRIRKVREFYEIDVDAKGGKTVKKLFWYETGENEGFTSLPMEELMYTKTAQVMMELMGISEERFIEEYQNRIEFLKWLKEMGKAKPEMLELEGMRQLMENFYLDKKFYKEIPIPKVAVQKKEEEPIVKPKPTIKIPEIAKAKETENKSSTLEEIKIVGIGPHILSPVKIVKKQKLKTQHQGSGSSSSSLLKKIIMKGKGP